jgi:hypothetical protein
MKTIHIISIILLLIGGLNWGLIGIFDYNLVAELFGAMSATTTVIYILVGIAGVVELCNIKNLLS